MLSQDFLDKHRKSHKNFTRNRKLPFHLLILLLLNFVNGSYQDELDKFFQALNQTDVAQRIVSKAAFTKARMKLEFETFIDLNRHLNGFFYKHFNTKTWFGYRLVAVDGSTVKLPCIEEIANHFGTWKGSKGEPCPIARVSQMFDTLSKISIDAIISPKKTGERELASQHCQNLLPNDLFLLDRGYPSGWLFKLILLRGANVCARISWKKWNIVKRFYHSGLKEKIIELPITGVSRKKCLALGLDTKPIKLRLIRVELDTGETEILITSLIDSLLHPYYVFMELYHLRWPVEEDYKIMKCWLKLENFSGKSILSIYQDFHAKIFSKNLTSAIAFPTQKAVEQNNANRKYAYQINFAQALSKTKNVIVLVFKRTKKRVLLLISDLQHIFVQTVEPIRPGRKYPRNHKVSRRKFFMNYKPFA